MIRSMLPSSSRQGGLLPGVVMYARRRSVLAFSLFACTVFATGCDPNVGGGALQGRASSEWTRNYTLAPDGELQVVGASGPIVVDGVEGNEIEVRATRTVRAAREAEARDLVQRVRINEDVSPGRVVLRNEGLGGMGLGRQVGVDFHVRVPVSTRLRLHTANGNIRVSNVAGTVVMSTDNGVVLGRGLSAGVDAQTANGSVTLELKAVGDGAITARSTNGGVSVSLPASARATVDAVTTAGSVDAAALGLVPDGPQSPQHVRGTMNGGGPLVTLSTTNGDVQVRPQP